MEEKKKENGKERKMNEIKTAVLLFVVFLRCGESSVLITDLLFRVSTRLVKSACFPKSFCMLSLFPVLCGRTWSVLTGAGRWWGKGAAGGGCTVDCVNWQNRGFHSTMVEKIQSTLCTVRTRPLLQSFVPTFLLLWIVFQLLCVNHSAFKIWDGMGGGAEAQNCKPHSKMHACACAPRLLHVLWRLSCDR